MEFHFISWIDFYSWRSDISCKRWSLAFPKPKPWQRQEQSFSHTAEHIVERGRRWQRKKEIWGWARMAETLRWRQTGPKQTKRRELSKQGQRNSKALFFQQSQKSQTHSTLLHSDSCALIPTTSANKCDLCKRWELSHKSGLHVVERMSFWICGMGGWWWGWGVASSNHQDALHKIQSLPIPDPNRVWSG